MQLLNIVLSTSPSASINNNGPMSASPAVADC
jgi:hypothetical protein